MVYIKRLKRITENLRPENHPLVIKESGRRKYYINCQYQKYMSAQEVKYLLEEVGFSRNPELLKAHRLLSHKDPLTEGNVFQINYRLARLHQKVQ